jgi:hypothetical protein
MIIQGHQNANATAGISTGRSELKHHLDNDSLRPAPSVATVPEETAEPGRGFDPGHFLIGLSLIRVRGKDAKKAMPASFEPPMLAAQLAGGSPELMAAVPAFERSCFQETPETSQKKVSSRAEKSAGKRRSRANHFMLKYATAKEIASAIQILCDIGLLAGDATEEILEDLNRIQGMS